MVQHKHCDNVYVCVFLYICKRLKGLFDTKALNERVHLIAKSPRGRRSNRKVSFPCPTLCCTGSYVAFWLNQSRHRVNVGVTGLSFDRLGLSPRLRLNRQPSPRLDDDYTLTRRTHATFVLTDRRHANRFKSHIHEHWQQARREYLIGQTPPSISTKNHKYKNN